MSVTTQAPMTATEAPGRYVVAKVVAAAWQANGREAGEEALKAYYSERGHAARTETETETIMALSLIHI